MIKTIEWVYCMENGARARAYSHPHATLHGHYGRNLLITHRTDGPANEREWMEKRANNKQCTWLMVNRYETLKMWFHTIIPISWILCRTVCKCVCASVYLYITMNFWHVKPTTVKWFRSFRVVVVAAAFFHSEGNFVIPCLYRNPLNE